MNYYKGNTHTHTHIYILSYGGACGVIIIMVGNGYGDLSSNPRQGCLHFI